ncbi:MAG TPA: MBL fold metallo-hydrolase [Clostridia bacterium]
MNIKTITTDLVQSNTYIITSNKSAVIIDPSGTDKIFFKIESCLKDIRLKAVLFTHGHFDHVALGHKYEGKVPIYIHKLDSFMLNSDQNLGEDFGYAVKPCKADVLLNGGEVLKFDDITVKVLHTPGHTQGSVCFVIDNYIFSGDTLFRSSIGRTDFEGGSQTAILKSINCLFMLDGDYVVYPGHGEPTTLRYEQKTNPYI